MDAAQQHSVPLSMSVSILHELQEPLLTPSESMQYKENTDDDKTTLQERIFLWHTDAYILLTVDPFDHSFNAKFKISRKFCTRFIHEA